METKPFSCYNDVLVPISHVNKLYDTCVKNDLMHDMNTAGAIQSGALIGIRSTLRASPDE